MTLTHRVRHLFLAHPNEWIDGRELAKIGGYAAWRTRLSECRQRFGMAIENRVTHHEDHTVSKYRYTPERLF